MDYQPRLDEHGVGWCSEECPAFDGKPCGALGFHPVPGFEICLPWARAAARDHAAMEAIRSCDHMTVMTPGTEAAFVAWQGKDGACCYADDPASAILAARGATKP